MDNKEASWIKHYWRPAIAWQYFAVCLFDFIIAPFLLGLFAFITGGTYIMWIPLTLQNGGLYHLSMGAIIGVSAWSRGQEKIKRILTGEEIPSEIETTTETQTPINKKK
tara:strand:- start:9254 stop:9580 length:327 start_codon:yes stop_codon:yes gene_type:complete